MSTAVWILREEARSLAETIAEGLGASVETAPKGENRETFRRRFREASAWVIVGASGVATRFVSGLLESKQTDPAVVAVDEAARFAIPLAGGHEGGANQIAYAISRLTGATPVITTATEALKPLVVGVGCRRGVASQKIEEAVLEALPEGRGPGDIREIVTVDRKADETGLLEWAAGLGLPLRIVSSEQIAARPWTSQPSDWVHENLGLPGVCEPAALIVSTRGQLVVEKTSKDGVSVAVVEDSQAQASTPTNEPPKIGKLVLVSLGPGGLDLIAPRARAAISQASEVVGYDLYLDLIAPWLGGKTVHRMPLTQERARAEKAIELAREQKFVALVSSGDIGIYAMATLVFELLDEDTEIELEVVPGITAATSCAALLGAPLAHDFATLSLSDLLCPWEWIERRARAIAEADLAVALYNVQSKTRTTGAQRVIDLMLEHKSPETVCGIVRNAWRDDQQIRVCTLRELREQQFDMLTTVIIGNRFTRQNAFGMYSPRGYLQWEDEPDLQLPEGAIWVFTGTHDGNELARRLSDAGHAVVVSVATDYGVEAAQNSLGDAVTVINGAVGSEQRRSWLETSRARAVIDATHPFASRISPDLIAAAEACEISYLRYERSSEVIAADDCEFAPDFESATQRAAELGKRVFLATGAKELDKIPESGPTEWFVRLAPDPTAMERAIKLGIPRRRLCFMQGPFSTALNQAQWQDWKIDCIVTRESGSGSGLVEKLQAAKALSIPVIVIRRPHVDYPSVVFDLEEACERVAKTLEQD
ncbi:MAG: precorrin-3B C(17)-methyltransferase [Verrucomicrobiota bacterium]